jgi:hypothetical protein
MAGAASAADTCSWSGQITHFLTPEASRPNYTYPYFPSICIMVTPWKRANPPRGGDAKPRTFLTGGSRVAERSSYILKLHRDVSQRSAEQRPLYDVRSLTLLKLGGLVYLPSGISSPVVTRAESAANGEGPKLPASHQGRQPDRRR